VVLVVCVRARGIPLGVHEEFGDRGRVGAGEKGEAREQVLVKFEHTVVEVAVRRVAFVAFAVLATAGADALTDHPPLADYCTRTIEDGN
jgi:hypothetical protein